MLCSAKPNGAQVKLDRRTAFYAPLAPGVTSHKEATRSVAALPLPFHPAPLFTLPHTLSPRRPHNALHKVLCTGYLQGPGEAFCGLLRLWLDGCSRLPPLHLGARGGGGAFPDKSVDVVWAMPGAPAGEASRSPPLGNGMRAPLAGLGCKAAHILQGSARQDHH